MTLFALASKLVRRRSGFGGHLVEEGFPVVCLESRHAKAALSAMTVKTDRNDAQGLAQIVRTGWFKAVHLKSAAGQRLRTLTAARKAAVRAVTANEQVIRGLLRPLWQKIGAVTRARFEDRVRQLIGADRLLLGIFEPLLRMHRGPRENMTDLHRLVLRAVRADPICRRLMTMPGIGPVTALTYRATIDDRKRFRRSRSVTQRGVVGPKGAAPSFVEPHRGTRQTAGGPPEGAREAATNRDQQPPGCASIHSIVERRRWLGRLNPS
jgi:transposase